MQDIIHSDTTVYSEPKKPVLKGAVSRNMDWALLAQKLKAQSGMTTRTIAGSVGMTENKLTKIINETHGFDEGDQALALLNAYLVYCDESPPKIGDFE
jgi:hypothetical protein